MLLKLFGQRETEDRLFADKAANVRDLGVRISLLTRIFMAVDDDGPGAGDGPRLRRRRPPRHRRHPDRRHPARPRHPAAAAARPAAGPLQRPDRRDDRAGQLRAGLRGARPAVADRGEAGRGRPAARRRPRLEFDHVGFTYPRADEISLASLETVARTSRATPARCSTTSRFRAEPGQMVALVGPSGAGKTTVTHLVARLYDAGNGAVRVGGHDVRDVTLQSLEDVVGYVTQDAHMFHDTIRANLLYARPDADDEADVGRPGGRADRALGPVAARRPRHRRRRPRLPALRRRAAAARDRAAAAQGAVDRRPRRGDRPPRQRVGGGRAAGPRRRAGRAHLAGDRPPALHGPQRRPDPGARGRPDRAVRHPRRAARPRAGSTPTSTAPSSSRTSRRLL